MRHGPNGELVWPPAVFRDLANDEHASECAGNDDLRRCANECPCLCHQPVLGTGLELEPTPAPPQARGRVTYWRAGRGIWKCSACVEGASARWDEVHDVVRAHLVARHGARPTPGKVAQAERGATRAECPHCQHLVAINDPEGAVPTLRVHGPRADRCAGSSIVVRWEAT